MKIALLDLYSSIKSTDNLIDAHVRNTLEIAKYLKCNATILESDFTKIINEKYDVIVFNYGSSYMPFKKLKMFTENNENAKYYYILNEYNVMPTGTIAKYNPHYILNFEKQLFKVKKNSKSSVLNLNLLLSKLPNELIDKKYDCIYYGTFRIGRSKYFQEYIKENIYLSTSPKNFKKYKHIGCTPKYITKLSWKNKKETLNLFKYQLYIEDEYTHTAFNNLANRYYEAGFCNNVIFFDVNCRNTINKSELSYYKEQVKDYIVKSYEDLQSKIKECNKDFEKHLAIQKSWRMNEANARNNMLKELKNIIYNGTK